MLPSVILHIHAQINLQISCLWRWEPQLSGQILISFMFSVKCDVNPLSSPPERQLFIERRVKLLLGSGILN